MSIFDRFRPYPELRLAIVNLKSGTAFQGVVWKRGRNLLVLKNAVMLADLGAPVESKSLDGDVLVLSAEVDFVQVL